MVDFVEQDQVSSLIELYRVEHNLSNENGGMFLSTFSKDIEYRRRIHARTHDILLKSFNKFFVNYDDNINSFAIKTPGKKSHFVIHQDVAAIDETKHSLLNIWTPLDNVILDNGPLFVIPGSHRIFSPYRCPTVPSIISNLQSELYKYAIPVYLNLGQAIFFDPRVVHFSTPNLSTKDRVVIQSRIYPHEANVVVYYNGDVNNKNRVEKYNCPKDYFIYGSAYNDDSRPEGCVFDGFYSYPNPISRRDFEKLKVRFNLKEQMQFIDPNTHQVFIKEPKV